MASVKLDDLRRLYHVPLHVAASNLQISETMVKRVARRFGIKKWPYRQVRMGAGVGSWGNLISGELCIRFVGSTRSYPVLKVKGR